MSECNATHFVRHHIHCRRVGDPGGSLISLTSLVLGKDGIDDVLATMRKDPSVDGISVVTESVRSTTSDGSYALVAFRDPGDARALQEMLSTDSEASCIFSRRGSVPVISESILDGDGDVIEDGIVAPALGSMLADLCAYFVGALREIGTSRGKDDPQYRAGLSALHDAFEKILLNDRQRAYIGHGGTRCPCCESPNVVPKDGHVDAPAPGSLEQEMRCSACEATFVAVYQLAGYRRLRDAFANEVDPDDID